MKGKKDEMEFEDINNFFNFLQGGEFPSITLQKYKVKLTPKEAFHIIYVLQEGVGCIPDHIELCSECKCLFDTNCGGDNTECMIDTGLCNIVEGENIMISDEDYEKVKNNCSPDPVWYCNSCLPQDHYFEEIIRKELEKIKK